jgi:hypothetical protein
MNQPYETSKNFPKPQNYGEIFCGRGVRFIKWLRRHDYEKFQCLVNTMLISVKGCMPRPSQDELDEAKLSWAVDIFMTEPPPECPVILNAIDRYVTEVMDGRKCKVSDVFETVHVPSTSANYVNSRAKGGCVVPLLQKFGKDGDVPDLDFRSIEPATEFDLTYLRSAFDVETDISKLHHWVDDNNQQVTCLGNVVIPPSEDIRLHYTNVYRHCIDIASNEDNLVEPVSLSEALKVRMITKCPPFLMFVMNGFIDPLRKDLRRLPVFELTGTPQESNIMDRMFRDPTRKFVSGDYVDSTNKLAPWVSNRICDVLCATYYSDVCAFEPRFPDLFKRALTGFAIDFRGQRMEQTMGQLMGSVASFPVLCLANYVLCKLSMEVNPSDWTGLLINGDDCVFEANEECYTSWCEYGRAMGLSPSPGKVWFQEAYIQMNSRSFTPYSLLEQYEIAKFYNTWSDTWMPEFPTHSHPEHLWKKVPIVLCGAAEGMTRSSINCDGGVDLTKVDFEGSLRAFRYELIGMEPSFREKGDAYFRKRMQHRIFAELDNPVYDSARKVISYNLPRKYGGLGMGGEFSQQDLRFASTLFNQGKTFPVSNNEKVWFFQNKVNDFLNTISMPTLLEDDDVTNYNLLYWWVMFINDGHDIHREPPGRTAAELVTMRLSREFNPRNYALYWNIQRHPVGPIRTKADIISKKTLGHRVMELRNGRGTHGKLEIQRGRLASCRIVL